MNKKPSHTFLFCFNEERKRQRLLYDLFSNVFKLGNIIIIKKA